MSENTVTGQAEKVTKGWTEQAEQAVAAADTAKLRHLLHEACAHNVKLAQAFDGMLLIYRPKDDVRDRTPESESVVAAMRDVALAAIELCKAVAPNQSHLENTK